MLCTRQDLDGRLIYSSESEADELDQEYLLVEAGAVSGRALRQIHITAPAVFESGFHLSSAVLQSLEVHFWHGNQWEASAPLGDLPVLTRQQISGGSVGFQPKHYGTALMPSACSSLQASLSQGFTALSELIAEVIDHRALAIWHCCVDRHVLLLNKGQC